MNTASTQTSTSNGVTSAHDLFALSDEQILQIEPEAQDIEIFAGERSDPLDPLREDLELLANAASANDAASANQAPSHIGDDGLKAVASNAAQGPTARDAQAAKSTNANGASTDSASAAPPSWLAERMNDAQHGAEARELWQATQRARQEVSAFREVFAKPEEARAAASRARMLDEIDGAYFGPPGLAPEQVSASRAQLAAVMMREDPAAFREMVFAGLRALEAAGHAAAEQGSAAQLPRLAQAFRSQSPEGANANQSYVAPPLRSASSSTTNANAAETPQMSQSPTPSTQSPASQSAATQTNAATQQDARLAAYAAFERAANDELERGVSGAIDRSLQQALPHAAHTENGAALKQRLSSAIRQDVERALQGDRVLGEQVARILAGQRLDAAARAQVVRLIGERAQQLIPTAARRVLADWTQTTLSTHAMRTNRNAQANGATVNAPTNANSAPLPIAAANRSSAANQPSPPAREAARHASHNATGARGSRKFDYRQLSDDDILSL